MQRKFQIGESMVGDIVALAPGWLVCAAIEPFTAAVMGLPAAAALWAARRTWWADQPVAGLIASFVLMPVLTLLGMLFAAFGFSGLAPGAVLAAVVIAGLEIWNRRAGRSLVRGFPVATTALFIAFFLSFSTLLLETGATRYPTEQFVQKLSAAPAPPVWSQTAREQAVSVVEAVIRSDGGAEDSKERLRSRLAGGAPDLSREKSPHGVYLTVYEKSGYRSRGFGSGGEDALDDVLRAALDLAKKPVAEPGTGKSRAAAWKEAGTEPRVQIDIPGARRAIVYRPFYHLFAEPLRGIDSALEKLEPIGLLLNLSFEIEPGVDGLAIKRSGGDKEAVMLPADPVTSGWLTPRVRSLPVSIRKMIRRAWKERFGAYPNLEKEPFTLSKFRTESFGRPGPGRKVVRWFRGNLVLDGDLTRDRLVSGIIGAADWLSRQVIEHGAPGEAGRFHYEIYPPYQARTNDYNLPRHAGSIYGLFAFFSASRSEKAFEAPGRRALAAGLTALDYVKSSLGTPDPAGAPEMLCFLETDGGASSGSTALAAISLTELPNPRDVADPELRARVESVPVDRWLARLGDCMLAMVDPDGAVFRAYDEAKARDRVEKEPLYFPGEVLLALVRTYARLGDARFLAGARRIADRQMRRFRVYLWLGWPEPGDHWIMQGLNELYKVTKERRYGELAVLMGRGSLREQYPPQAYIYPDYRGAYRRVVDVPRTTRAGSRGEAIGGSWESARLLGEDTRALEGALLEGARHLIEQQFVPENSYFVPADQDVLGGIRMGIVDNHLRIDNNQHGLVALLRALQALDAGKR